jgi:hypothetical protein
MDTDDALLSLETFQQPDFNVATLVSGLTDRLIKKSREEGGGERHRFPSLSIKQCNTLPCLLAFDPKPFVFTLESAVDSLTPLRRQVASRTKEIESDVLRAEKDHSSKLMELRENFEVRIIIVHILACRIRH